MPVDPELKSKECPFMSKGGDYSAKKETEK